jgi:hypothetical protein
MDGVHDMGGMHGFGPVVQPGAELAYHERWEPRVFAIQLLVGVEGLGAGPGGRPVREEMDPAHYLAASYYERWLYSAEQRLLRKGTRRVKRGLSIAIRRWRSGSWPICDPSIRWRRSPRGLDLSPVSGCA